jgi:catechol 2,3-dioxygenase-like lactoylglutathione lyase family enzyme
MRGLTLDRVIVATDDVESSVDRFGELLGLEFGEMIPGVTIEQYAVGHPGIEVAEPGDEDGEIAEILSEYGPGPVGVVFRVADLEEVKTSLAEKGVEPLTELDIQHAPEVLYHPEEFDGVMTVFTEYRHPVERRESTIE